MGATRSQRGSAAEATYSLGAVSRLTGLSPHVLRAWERRYGAVSPRRTPGGTRRYRESDVARLRLLAAAVEAGHRIGDVASLSDAELRRRATRFEAEPRPQLEQILEAVERLDAEQSSRLLGLQLAALGPRRFVTAVVLPLMRQVGDRWHAGRLCIAAEHLASNVIRDLLGASLRRTRRAAPAPALLVTTLAGDRHELGALACAVIAAELGAHVIYLGPDLPAAEIATAAETAQAAVVLLGISRFAPAQQRQRAVRELQRALPRRTSLWAGGRGSDDIVLPAGVEHVGGIEELEQKVALLAFRPEQRSA